MSNIQNALNNVSRFISFELAQSRANHQIKPGFILLGDDGKYWVTANLRDGQILQRSGYELAPKF